MKNFFTNKDSKPQKQNKEKSASEFLIDYYKQIENRPAVTKGVGSLMNLSELNIDDFNNDSLRRILNKGLDNPGSLFGRELELFELMRKNQKLGIPNFAVDGPVII